MSLPTSFSIGLDTDHNRLVIEATPRRLNAAVKLCQRLDTHVEGIGLPLQLVSADSDTCAVAKNLAPQLDRLVTQRGPMQLAQNNAAPSRRQ